MRLLLPIFQPCRGTVAGTESTSSKRECSTRAQSAAAARLSSGGQWHTEHARSIDYNDIAARADLAYLELQVELAQRRASQLEEQLQVQSP